MLPSISPTVGLIWARASRRLRMGGRFCGLRPRPASRRPLTWSIHAGILRHIRGRRDPLAVWAAIVARTKEGLDDLDAKHGDDRRGRRGSAGGAGDLLRAAT